MANFMYYNESQFIIGTLTCTVVGHVMYYNESSTHTYTEVRDLKKPFLVSVQ